MKVLQLIYESLGSPFGFGGAGVRAYEIYKRLGGRHDITLLCMKYPGSRDGEIEGLRHLFVGTESRSLTMSVLAYTVRDAHFVYKHGNEFDVIVENFLPSTPFLAGLLTRKPVVLQVQGIMERHAMRKFSPLYAFPMYLVEMSYPRLYNRFIFVSYARLQPDSPLPYYYMGKVYVQEKDYRKAEKSYRKALEKEPGHEASLMELAVLYEERKKTEKAIAIYRSILEYYPRHVGAQSPSCPTVPPGRKTGSGPGSVQAVG